MKKKYILQRSSLFSETATFQQYANSLRKARYLFRKPTDWSAFAIRLAGKNRIRFHNFIRSELIWRIVSSEPGNSLFPRLPFLACLFTFRAPSEALLLQRAHKGGDIDIPPPPKGDGVNCAPYDRRPKGAHRQTGMEKTHARRVHYEAPLLLRS